MTGIYQCLPSGQTTTPFPIENTVKSHLYNTLLTAKIRSHYTQERSFTPFFHACFGNQQSNTANIALNASFMGLTYRITSYFVKLLDSLLNLIIYLNIRSSFPESRKISPVYSPLCNQPPSTISGEACTRLVSDFTISLSEYKYRKIIKILCS